MGECVGLCVYITEERMLHWQLQQLMSGYIRKFRFGRRGFSRIRPQGSSSWWVKPAILVCWPSLWMKVRNGEAAG